MKCKKCGSENVNTQVVSEQVVRTMKHGILYWILIGWWIWIFKLLLFPITILLNLFSRTEKISFTEHKTMCVCQNCGYTWKAR